MKQTDISYTTTSENISEKSLNDEKSDGVLATFEGILTTTSEDRDADIMEAKGANIDPQMPLLLNHNTDRPVGKFLGVVSRNDDKIVGKFAVIDNDLGNDALKLMKMGVLSTTALSQAFQPVYSVFAGQQSQHVTAPSRLGAVVLD